MNHPYETSSNANLVYQQKLDDAANARRVKALRSGQQKRSLFARLFGLGKSANRPEAAKKLETQTESGRW